MLSSALTYLLPRFVYNLHNNFSTLLLIMSSLFGSGDYDDGGALPKGGDPELQDFLMREKQRAQFNAQVSLNQYQKRSMPEFGCLDSRAE